MLTYINKNQGGKNNMNKKMKKVITTLAILTLLVSTSTVAFATTSKESKTSSLVHIMIDPPG